MCGICGFASYKGNYSQEERHSVVCRMNEQIIHRGPDSEGIYDGDWLTMGMRRLSIIDLGSGNQPIFSVSGTKVIVFNGEIYNYIELKIELEKKGYIFKTTSDTEVIANLFEEYGCECFRMLDGMFAISLYDTDTKKLYLVRDRMGEKPLYYYSDHEKLLYGSELKCLQCTRFISKDINVAALNFYFQYTYIPSPYSIYKNVFKLLPGHYLVVSQNGIIKDKCYWKLEKNVEYAALTYEEAKEELYHRVNESIKKRMRSDVPIGAFLSGGLDSGTVVALMARNSSVPVNTFTIGLNAEGDESGRALQMAKHVGANHTNFILDYQDSIDIVSDIVNHMDEPFADSSCIPTYLVSKLACKHVKTVLTGDAGDELFLGYSKYLINYYADKYLKIPAIFRKGLIEPAYRVLPDKSSFTRQVGKVINTADKDIFQRRNTMMQLGFKDEECKELFKKDYYDLSGQKIISSYYGTVVGNDIEKTQNVDLHVVLEGDMLTKVDRMSMLNSLETRTPFLSNDLVVFAYSLPSKFKLQGRMTKRIMKDTFRNLFPVGYDKLPKSGFGVPVDIWFRKEMKEELTDLLSEEALSKQDIFNPGYVNMIINEHMKETKNRKSELWALYLFQKWCITNN